MTLPPFEPIRRPTIPSRNLELLRIYAELDILNSSFTGLSHFLTGLKNPINLSRKSYKRKYWLRSGSPFQMEVDCIGNMQLVLIDDNEINRKILKIEKEEVNIKELKQVITLNPNLPRGSPLKSIDAYLKIDGKIYEELCFRIYPKFYA